MNMKQQSFAEAIEHRLRRRWPKVTVEYVGGGWFELRTDPMMPPSKVRREELREKVKRVEAALRDDGRALCDEFGHPY